MSSSVSAFTAIFEQFLTNAILEALAQRFLGELVHRLSFFSCLGRKFGKKAVGNMDVVLRCHGAPSI